MIKYEVQGIPEDEAAAGQKITIYDSEIAHTSLEARCVCPELCKSDKDPHNRYQSKTYYLEKGQIDYGLCNIFGLDAVRILEFEGDRESGFFIRESWLPMCRMKPRSEA